MMGATVIDKLQWRELFVGIPAFSSKHKTYQKGDIIIHEGMLGNDMFIILKGEVDVIVYTADGKEVLLATLREPEMFGEIALFDGQPRTATVIAKTDCELIRLTRAEFVEIIKEDPSMLFRLVRILVKRIRETDEKIKVLSMDSAVDRVKWFIRKMVAENRNIEINLPSHSEIGKLLCLTREAVTRALHALKREGIISNTTGTIYVNVEKII